jgi:predicted small lipoprotein YifL
MKTIAFAAIALSAAVAGFGLLGPLDKPGSDLRRVECSKITIFAPQGGKSDEDLCKSYGGLAAAPGQETVEGLVILVRNQPMGGFDGHGSVR